VQDILAANERPDRKYSEGQEREHEHKKHGVTSSLSLVNRSPSPDRQRRSQCFRSSEIVPIDRIVVDLLLALVIEGVGAIEKVDQPLNLGFSLIPAAFGCPSR
jgi:hypothetical protein